jgi:hypothetical protein
MEHEIDKLFRIKLMHQAMQPSARAWERIKERVVTTTGAHVVEKNKSTLMWWIAASIALIVFAAWYSKDSDKGLEKLVEVKHTPAVEKKQTVEVDESKSEGRMDPIVEKRSEGSETVAIKKLKVQSGSDPVSAETVNEVPLEEEPMEVVVSSVEEAHEPQKKEVQVTLRVEKVMVIVYTLPTVEKDSGLEPEKVSGFKKAIAFAKDVKGGETTLASVRDWKDNFFGSEELTKIERQNNSN